MVFDAWKLVHIFVQRRRSNDLHKKLLSFYSFAQRNHSLFVASRSHLISLKMAKKRKYLFIVVVVACLSSSPEFSLLPKLSKLIRVAALISFGVNFCQQILSPDPFHSIVRPFWFSRLSLSLSLARSLLHVPSFIHLRLRLRFSVSLHNGNTRITEADVDEQHAHHTAKGRELNWQNEQTKEVETERERERKPSRFYVILK